AICPARERGKNLPCARLLGFVPRRSTNENPATARSVSGPADAVGSTDRDAAHGRIAVQHFMKFEGTGRQPWLKDTFGLRGFFEERDSHGPHAGLRGQAPFQVFL